MKKQLLVACGILIAAVIYLGVQTFFTSDQVGAFYTSAASLYGSDTVTLTEAETYDEGTTENPFVILEIVPYEGYAEIGYMIQGCEPIPMNVVTYDKEGGALIMSSTSGMMGDWVDEFTYELANEEKVLLDLNNPVDSTNIIELTNIDDMGKWRNSDQAEYGYYQKVTSGTGEYYQEKRTINSSDAVVFITSATNGNYNWIPYTDSSKPDGIHTTYDMWDVTETFDQDEVHTYRTQYYRGKYNFTYDEDHNKFLTEVLDIPYASVSTYKTIVVTITPGLLSTSNGLNLIDKADLISFAPESHYKNADGTNDMVQLWEKYYPSKVVTAPATGFGFNTGNRTCNDLTWEATVEILRKASVDNSIAPILFDAKIYINDSSFSWYSSSQQVTPVKTYYDGTSVTGSDITSRGYFNNISKLYLVMEQMDPAKFYNEYIRTSLIRSTRVTYNGTTQNVKTGTVNMTTGYSTEQQTTTAPSACNISSLNFKPAAVAWSIYTFLPYNLFANYTAIDNNAVWATIGIDNFAVIDTTLGNVSVRHNVYTYDGDKSLTKDLSTISKIGYNKATRAPFEYYGFDSGTISPAKAINFLLNLQSKLSYPTSNLRILEIEPCKDFIWNGTEAPWDANDTNLSSLSKTTKYARQFFAKFFPHYNGNVTITTMTSAEYIGNVDDINTKYDMVFFGLKDGKLTKDSSGNTTVYNDTTLNGKIYLHNGDLITMSNSKLKGLDDDDGTNTYRLSGNDITYLKYSELLHYMEAGNLIVFDKGFYDTTTKTAVNTSLIDRNSYMYDLANVRNESSIYEGQLFSTAGFDSLGMSTYKMELQLSKSKCKIVFGNIAGSLDVKNCKPVTYKDKSLDESLPDSEIYINANNTAFRTLQYKFYIEGNTSSATDFYTVKLYIDINADGKYEEATENITSLQIMNDAGYVVNYKKLKPGVNYTLSRTLEADYFGVLPWKLEIVSSTNSEIRDSVIDYCALQTSTPIDLYILQIKANNNSNNSFDNNLDLAAEMTNTTSPFYLPLNNLQDYEIHFTSWTVDEFINVCTAKYNKFGEYTYILSDDDDYTPSGENNSNNDDSDDFYDFDMLIMGFADCYSDIGSDLALQNIQDFIEEGKSVLFTHDTTSYVNMEESIYKGVYGFDDYWGYGLNSTVRNIFGMDRFGVLLDTEADRSNARKDYSTKNSSFENLHSGYIQGYSNMSLNRYAASNKWVNGHWGGPQYLSHVNVNNTDFTTSKVSNVNQGQLTVYPYLISETFDVATTHAQYYQLDMENEDIVVWYCLSDGHSSGNGRYSTTPNDVRNNYYIYNLGNITYSGVGHSKVTRDMEAKLFVNTMIGSYTATAKNPQVKITNKNTSADSTTNYIYVDYDIYDTDLATGSEVTTVDSTQDSTISSTEGTLNAQWVKFMIADYNLLFNKKTYVNFYDDPTSTNTEHLYYMINTGGTEETSDDVVMNKQLVNGTYMYKIDASEEYAIAVPLSKLNENNMSDTIGINVLITYGKTSTKTKTTSTTFKLVRRGLFDLD